jgi:phage terminase small subunit
VAGRIAQLRALGSELGMDPSSRARLGTKGSAAYAADVDDAAAKYINRRPPD